MTMKIGCNLLNAQESPISLIPQVHAGEKKEVVTIEHLTLNWKHELSLVIS